MEKYGEILEIWRSSGSADQSDNYMKCNYSQISRESFVYPSKVSVCHHRFVPITQRTTSTKLKQRQKHNSLNQTYIILRNQCSTFWGGNKAINPFLCKRLAVAGQPGPAVSTTNRGGANES